MQQEAVYLECTALGTRAPETCIQNLGINGTEYEDKIARKTLDLYRKTRHPVDLEEILRRDK